MISLETFRKNLKRNNFYLDEKDGVFKITQDRVNSKNVSWYLAVAILIALVLLAKIEFSIIIPTIGLIVFFNMAVRAFRIQKEESDNYDRVLSFKKSIITVEQSGKEVRIDSEQFDELYFEIEKDKKLSKGTIFIRLYNLEEIVLFEMYNVNPKYLEHDLEIIASFIEGKVKGL